jgi:hypothetical protein
MKPLVKNRFIDAGLKTCLLYALIHTTIMVVYVITGGDYQTLNSFRILGLQLFIPTIDKDVFGFYLSQIIPVAVFLYAYFCLTKKTK